MDVIKNRYKYIVLSLLIVLIGAAAAVFNTVKGNGVLNFDVEFTGGTELTVLTGDIPNSEIADVVKEITGQKSPKIQELIDTGAVSIRIQSVDSEMRTKLSQGLISELGLEDDAVLSVQDISGTISGEMQKASAIAILSACAAMLIYITIRFKNIKMGLSAILALCHDVLVMLAFYAVFRIPVNNSFIAAFLTVLGYSINATIVIFDRVRENKKIMEESTKEDIINTSINQTMRRSLYTSITTLLAIGAVYVFGVQSVKEFALPMMVGIISGAYSSVFISGSLWYMLTGGADGELIVEKEHVPEPGDMDYVGQEFSIEDFGEYED